MSIINQETGSLVGILLIMFYSLMVFCEMPFSVIWFLPVVFCFITTIASLDSPSQEAKHYKTVKKNNDQNQHKQHPRVNSNIARDSVRNNVHTLSLIADSNPIAPAKPKALYCQFCGSLRVKDAIYCYQCGSKLE